MKRQITLAFLLVLALTSPVQACSTFVLRSGDQIVFGRNYDYYIGYGIVFQNQRNLRKTAPFPGWGALSWVSKYASISCNQFGKEQPTDGMNEAGLVVALMQLDATRYPSPDARPSIGGLPWIQYQLDNCRTVEQVILTDSRVRIAVDGPPLHYLVADATGDVAVIEFLNGQMVVHRREDLPIPALTNSTYEQSINYLQLHAGFGGDRPIPESSSSLDRFVRLADRIVNYGPHISVPIVDYAFSALGRVAHGSFTRWTIVYDIAERRIHFKTRESTTVKMVRFDGFDFACRGVPKLIDIDYHGWGDVTGLFESFTTEANRQLIYNTYRSLDWLKNVPDSTLDALAAFPNTLVCNPQQRKRRYSETSIR